MADPDSLHELFKRARAGGELAPLIAAIPAARFLNLTADRGADGGLRVCMRFTPHLVGNALLPALHGGTLGALLESTAVFALLVESQEPRVPRIINLTVEYLRSARTVDTWARAELSRQGRRVATVRAFAWQDDPARPVAAANAHFLLSDEQLDTG